MTDVSSATRDEHLQPSPDAPPNQPQNPPQSPPIRNLPPVTERELAARARGLSTAYIEGGEDPDPELTRRQEAKYWRLLLGMLILIAGATVLFTVLDIASTGIGK